jgi:hypothetical protein
MLREELNKEKLTRGIQESEQSLGKRNEKSGALKNEGIPEGLNTKQQRLS